MFSNQTLLHAFTAIATGSTMAYVVTRKQEDHQAIKEILEFVGITYSITSLCNSVLYLFDSYSPLASLGFMFIPGVVAHFVEKSKGTSVSFYQTIKNVLARPLLLLTTVGVPLLMASCRYISFLFPGVEYSNVSEHFAAFVQKDKREQVLKEMSKMTDILVKTLPLYAPVAALGGGILNSIPCYGEERGWRGFLLPKLRDLKFGFWSRSYITGAIWGIWHIPLILNGHNYPQHRQLGSLLFVAIIILLSPFFTFVSELPSPEQIQEQKPTQQQEQLRQQNFEGSLRAAILHGAVNGCVQVSYLGLKGGTDLTIGMPSLSGLIVLATLNVLLYCSNLKFHIID